MESVADNSKRDRSISEKIDESGKGMVDPHLANIIKNFIYGCSKQLYLGRKTLTRSNFSFYPKPLWDLPSGAGKTPDHCICDILGNDRSVKIDSQKEIALHASL